MGNWSQTDQASRFTSRKSGLLPCGFPGRWGRGQALNLPKGHPCCWTNRSRRLRVQVTAPPLAPVPNVSRDVNDAIESSGGSCRYRRRNELRNCSRGCTLPSSTGRRLRCRKHDYHRRYGLRPRMGPDTVRTLPPYVLASAVPGTALLCSSDALGTASGLPLTMKW